MILFKSAASGDRVVSGRELVGVSEGGGD